MNKFKLVLDILKRIYLIKIPNKMYFLKEMAIEVFILHKN